MWMMLVVGVFFLFFKQKTAYEMRISDWSSDVCSSDLAGFRAGQPGLATDVFGQAAACAWFRQRIAQARLLTARRDVEVEQGAAVARDGVAQLGGEGIDQAALDAGLRDHAFALPRVFDAGRVAPACDHRLRSEEHTSELQSLMRISY